MYHPQGMEKHITTCPQANRLLDRGTLGEMQATRYLYENLKEKFVGNYRILVNYNFPMHGANTLEIDLLVITTWGIFLLEVKNWVGTIEASDGVWFLNGESRGNIFATASYKAKNIYSHVRTLYDLSFDPSKIGVTSLIVLIRGTQTFENKSNYDSQAVVGLDQKLTRALSSTRLLPKHENSQRLSEQDINTIHDTLFQRHDKEKEELVGNYRLLRKVRKAALFEEFEAQRTVSSQRVRLKCYYLHMLVNERVTAKTIEHFKRDLEVVEALKSHPNIVQTKDFFPDPNYYDLYYEVTEPIDGERLDEFMEKKSEAGSSISFKEQLGMLEALCEALQHAHNYQNEEGMPEPVYHRNISLQTVFLVRDGRSGRNVIKLADFDFAKFGKHTINPMHLGPDYRDKVWPQTAFTAPEVLKDPSNARAYSDIYALGILWYFLAQLPHYDPTIQFNPLTDAGKIDTLPLPSEALALLKYMLAYDKSQRPQHIEEVIEAIKLLKTNG